MFNVEADFDKKGNQVAFKKMKWKTPLESVTSVTLTMTEDRITLTLLADLDRQNSILLNAGFKKIKKNKRKLQFPDATTARDFLFHIKRVHHLWNRSGGRHNNQAIEISDKIGQK